MSNYPYSVYTMTLLEYLDRQLWDMQDLNMGESSRNNAFLDMFTSMYNLCEIGAETPDLFRKMVTDTFNEYKDYYNQLLDAYEKQYDYATGNKKITIRSETVDTDTDRISKNIDNNKHTEIELPNKQVSNPDDSYPSAIDKDESNSKNVSNAKAKTVREYTDTVEYKDEFIDLKNKYIEQIRNVYKEFCEKFKDCFMIIY